MKIISTKIDDCYVIEPNIFEDNRGSFVKTFDINIFKKLDLETSFVEEFYSVSNQNVLRGLHFQTPPNEHSKIVYCIEGAIFDAVLDLRKHSKTYQKFETFKLDSSNPQMLFIPEGVAHGFYVFSKIAVVCYKVSSIHSKSNDAGVLWNSADIPWPSDNPIMSRRDQSFIALKDFDSPF